MKIPGNDLRVKSQSKVAKSKPLGKGKGARPSTSPGMGSQDTTKISGDAVVVEQAIEAVLSSPELSRSEKISRIKKGIEDGTLEFNSRDVAQKILENLIQESEYY